MTIEIRQLDFAYRRTAVLREVSARAESGKITAVLGPNAAGKSTLLRCVIGTLRPTRGSVMIAGDDLRTLSVREIAQRIAYVPQRSVVSAAFTVRQVVELGRYALPRRDDRVDAAIEQMELRDIESRPYPELSVGQQQRVTLARALAQVSPNGCLVLDEPTSAMDLRHLGLTMALLREIADRGATVLLAMHDISLAASIADHVWLLDRGALVNSGPARESLSVQRLRDVFDVEFQWVNLPGGSIRLIANAPATQPVDRMASR